MDRHDPLRSDAESLGAPAPAVSVPVWDVAVRVFHWTLVAAVVTSWITGGTGERIHETVGYAVAGLMTFRMVWGVVGTRHARFRDFVRGPSGVLDYLSSMIKLRPAHHLGHNPAGALMILLLIAALLIIVISGVMMQSNRFFGVEWVEQVHSIAADSLLVFIPLHVLGALVSSWLHQENLIRAMFSGSKRAPKGFRPAGVQERLEFRLKGSEGLFMLSTLTLIGVLYGWTTAPVPAPEVTPPVAVESRGTIALAPTPVPSDTVAQMPPTPVPGHTLAQTPPTPMPVAPVESPSTTRMVDVQDYMTGGPEVPSDLWILASGGRLYDRWYAALGKPGPTTNHPSWPADNANLSGADTWRCKSCHGWDYLGRDGQLKSGSGATGVRGINRMRGRPVEEILAILENTTHRYTDDLIPGHAKGRLATFVSQGQHVVAQFIDPNGGIRGEPAKGRGLFQTLCAACHGFDGRGRKLGRSSDPNYTGKPLYVGTKAREVPIEVLHKIRNGHPGAAMISLRGLRMQSAADVLAYLQQLPVD